MSLTLFAALLKHQVLLRMLLPFGAEGPFGAAPIYIMALANVFSCWDSRIAWNANQREHAAQIIRAVETHKYATSFSASVHDRRNLSSQ